LSALIQDLLRVVGGGSSPHNTDHDATEGYGMGTLPDHERTAHERVMTANAQAEMELRTAVRNLDAARRRYEDRLRLDLG
jgi:hypothetical protein